MRPWFERRTRRPGRGPCLPARDGSCPGGRVRVGREKAGPGRSRAGKRGHGLNRDKPLCDAACRAGDLSRASAQPHCRGRLKPALLFRVLSASRSDHSATPVAVPRSHSPDSRDSRAPLPGSLPPSSATLAPFVAARNQLGGKPLSAATPRSILSSSPKQRTTTGSRSDPAKARPAASRAVHDSKVEVLLRLHFEESAEEFEDDALAIHESLPSQEGRSCRQRRSRRCAPPYLNTSILHPTAPCPSHFGSNAT